MDKSIPYIPPISRYTRQVSYEDWFLSTEYFEKKDYYNSFKYLLKYINAPIDIPDSDTLDLTVPQGSVYLRVKADKEKYSFSIPFLKFTKDSNRIAAMRRMIEQNFSSLILSQIVLREDELYFHYEDNIYNAEPYKIYFTLDEMSTEADNTDDYYIDRFNLEHIIKPDLDYFTSEEYEKSKELFYTILNDSIAGSEYFEGKRNYNSACDYLALCLFKIKYVIFPQGILGREIQEILNYMYSNEGVNTILNNTRLKIKKLIEIEESKFKDSLFHPKFFIPIKPRLDLIKLQEILKPIQEKTQEIIGNKAYQESGIYILYNLYYILDGYSINSHLQDSIEHALSDVSQKDWKFTSDYLLKLINNIMIIKLDEEGNITSGTLDIFETSKEKKSKMNSIFSKIRNIFK